MQTIKNTWPGILRIGVFVIPLVLFSLFAIKPKAEEKVSLVCPVHQEQLKQEPVKIVYGLRGPLEKGYVEASHKLFPYSNKNVSGGCVLNRDSPKFQTVDYCPKCRRAETRWRSARMQEGRES